MLEMPFSQLSERVIFTQVSVFISLLQRYHHHSPHSGLCSSSYVSLCEIISFICYFFKVWGCKNWPFSLFHSQHLVWALAYIKGDISMCRIINEYLFYLYKVLSYQRCFVYFIFITLLFIFIIWFLCFLFLKCPLPYYSHYSSFKTGGFLSCRKLSPPDSTYGTHFSLFCVPSAKTTFYCIYLIFVSFSDLLRRGETHEFSLW